MRPSCVNLEDENFYHENHASARISIHPADARMTRGERFYNLVELVA